jgi:hypothetical protein
MFLAKKAPVFLHIALERILFLVKHKFTLTYYYIVILSKTVTYFSKAALKPATNNVNTKYCRHGKRISISQAMQYRELL